MGDLQKSPVVSQDLGWTQASESLTFDLAKN